MQRFFIVGCQRTGTTLVRLVLESHPRVYCLDEIHAYAALAGTWSAPFPDVDLVGYKIPRWTEQLSEPVLHDEGLQEQTSNFYRKERIIFLLRNVKDTIASMLKLRAGESSWLDLWVPRILEYKIRCWPCFQQRFSAQIGSLAGSRDPRIASAALYWRYKTIAYFDYLERGWPVLGIRYEQLVRTPEPVLRKVCSFLEIDWEDRLLRHESMPHGELFADGSTVGGTNPGRAIHEESVEQWDRFLSEEQIAEIMTVAGDLEARLPEL